MHAIRCIADARIVQQVSERDSNACLPSIICTLDILPHSLTPASILTPDGSCRSMLVRVVIEPTEDSGVVEGWWGEAR